MKCPNCGTDFESKFCPNCGFNSANASQSNDTSQTETADKNNIGNETMDQGNTNTTLQTNEPISATKKMKWFQKSWFVILMLIFLWPVGLCLMWVYKTNWNKIIKIIITALFLIGTIIYILGNGNNLSSISVSNTENTETTTTPKQIKSISATYIGATDSGIVLDSENEDIKVTATYDDGSTANVFGFEIQSPATLTAGQDSTVTIEYRNLTCDLTVTCTTVDPDSYKSSCQTVSYDELARNPDSNIGKLVKFTGEIIQVMDDGTSATFRINVTKGDYDIWDDTVLVTYDYSDGESRFLEDDIITFYGMSGGLYTYESTMGANITIPLVYAEYMDLN